MAQNAAGFQKIADMGYTPSVFTGRAIATAISGGHLVYAGSQANPLSSGVNSFVVDDVWINEPASGTNYPVGVAVTEVIASGTSSLVEVCTRGLLILQADGAIVPGQFVGAVNGAHAVAAVGSQDNPVVAMNRIVGRALTSAGSNQYCLVNLNI